MNPDEIRKQTILALFSDEFLFERLVLKGGNAIYFVHKLDIRASLDLDFSMAGDFEDLNEARRHLFSTLKSHFSALGFMVFDERLRPKPMLQGPDERPWWGGYELRFKLISNEKFDRLRDKPEKMRIDALPIGRKQERSFSVDFSKHEFTGAKITVDFGEYSIPVYSLEMIAIEKLRAICQQMSEYGIKGAGSPRARDFYDIHLILSKRGIDLTTEENRALIRNIFQAKKASLRLLANIENYREFHRTDWPTVIDAVGTAEGFDFYFDFVLTLVKHLQSFRMVDAP